MKDITVLIAHPDDEVLFAWPVWDRIANIICLSSDKDNPERQWCSQRRHCLYEVGIELGCAVTCFDLNSEFYRMPTRDGTLKRAMEGLIAVLAAGKSEIIFTHNQHGEYGNIDHILCHHVARTYQAMTREHSPGCDLRVSDIAQEVNWLPIEPWKQGELVSRHTLDRARFDALKAIYTKRGCWTWSQEPVTECGVYRI